MNTIILIDGRGDYLTKLDWERDGKAACMGGSREDAIRFTPEEASRLLDALGDGYSAEEAA